MNTGILITVRLKSTRLPRKALIDIGGKPLIEHLLARMESTSFGHNVVLMTSNLADDDELVSYATKRGTKYYRGDPVDVLARMRNAARQFGFDRVISVTGDNPFVDPEGVEMATAFQESERVDFVETKGLPWGTFCYILTQVGMEKACTDKAETDTEVWGDYFRGNPSIRCGVLEIMDSALVWPDLRLTVDTPEDLLTARTICAGIPAKRFGVREIIQFCKQHPEVVAINSRVQQKAANNARFRLETN